jgi:hypothetical protein
MNYDFYLLLWSDLEPEQHCSGSGQKFRLLAAPAPQYGLDTALATYRNLFCDVLSFLAEPGVGLVLPRLGSFSHTMYVLILEI